MRLLRANIDSASFMELPCGWKLSCAQIQGFLDCDNDGLEFLPEHDAVKIDPGIWGVERAQIFYSNSEHCGWMPAAKGRMPDPELPPEDTPITPSDELPFDHTPIDVRRHAFCKDMCREVWEKWRGLPEGGSLNNSDEIMRHFLDRVDPLMPISHQKIIRRRTLNALEKERELRTEPNYLGEGI